MSSELSLEFAACFDYSTEDEYESYPQLPLYMFNPAEPARRRYLNFFFDSGASRTFISEVWIDPLGLERKTEPDDFFTAVNGSKIDFQLHRIAIGSPDLGFTELDVAFGRTSRDLLGRDFLNHANIGLNHKERLLYITNIRTG